MFKEIEPFYFDQEKGGGDRDKTEKKNSCEKEYKMSSTCKIVQLITFVVNKEAIRF